MQTFLSPPAHALRAIDICTSRACPPPHRCTLHTLGIALQSQEEGHCLSLPPPSWGREGSHTEELILTLCLNSVFSSKVMVSALAITGMIFTTLLRCFMNSRSKGRRLHPKKEQRGRGQFIHLAFHASDSQHHIINETSIVQTPIAATML